ncbi:MAG: hypothetical protein RJB13_922 [Pseudomonadota bacterium]
MVTDFDYFFCNIEHIKEPMNQMAAQRGGSQSKGVYPPDHSRVPAHHAPALSKCHSSSRTLAKKSEGGKRENGLSLALAQSEYGQ